jgi:hypothetical protein
MKKFGISFFVMLLVVLMLSGCYATAPHEKYRGNENYAGATCNFTPEQIRAMGPKRATEWARACREIARTNREWAESEREWTKSSRPRQSGVSRSIERGIERVINDAFRNLSRDLF